jgi:phage terminase large subunit-like protein
MNKLLIALSALKKAPARSPVDHVPWLPTQLEFLKHNDNKIPYLFRAGNRQGKTTVGAAEVIFRARGSHPFKDVPQKPQKIAVVCMSLLQSLPIQEMIWELMDKNILQAGVTFNKKTGFGAHTPLVQLRNGSSIKFFGCAQGAEALAGAEFDFILLDEPPDQTVYDECIKRVSNTGGNIALTLTPINGPPLPWLRAFCEEGIVKDYHMKLTPESQISPLTGKVRLTKAGTPWDAAFIQHLIKLTSPIDAPIRINGEWNSIAEGQFFKTFNKNNHIVDHIPEGNYKIGLGIDYASADRENGLCAVLSFWETVDSKAVYFAVDEVAIHGSSTMKEFSEEIIKMLKRHDLKWTELDYVWGDNPVASGSSYSSNIEVAKALKKILKTKTLKPDIRSVKTGAGASNKNRRAKDIRCRWLYSEITNDNFYVLKACKWLSESLQMWDYSDSSEHKDILDACMYGLKTQWATEHTWTPVQINIV